jgi:alanyl-tRNA synthetase
VRRTGDIGPVKIVSESSIGSNLRRIEAVTGTGPIERLRREEAELAAVAERIGVPQAELLDGIDKRLAELRDLRAEVRSLRSKLASSGASELAASAVDGVVVARADGLGRDDLRSLAVAVRDRPGIRAVVLIGAPEGGGVALVAATTPGGDLDAGTLLAGAARTVGGGGGKHPDLAVAGGKDAGRIDEALDVARAAAGLVPQG